MRTRGCAIHSGAVLSLLLTLFFPLGTKAELLSFHNAHPIGWMYALPVGATPGWSTPTWFNLEFNQANIWNTPLTMTDRRNGDTYTYRADYEQSSAIADFGLQLLPRLALSFEVPYANHNGGFLDDFIDQFHLLIQTDRFERNNYPKYKNNIQFTKNGVDLYKTNHAEGVGGFKTKLKLWLLKWQSPTPGACDCGLAVSGHVKFPTQTSDHGLSSGSNDYTGMVHLGMPLGSSSGLWLTSAFTKLGHNRVFEGLPMRTWSQMYEASLNMGLDTNWGVIMQVRYESPLFNKDDLQIKYSYAEPHNQAIERVNSGWNSLVYWRGAESIGLRYRWGMGSQINFLFVEDWARGKYDSTGGFAYINNAPDVEFLTQWHFVF